MIWPAAVTLACSAIINTEAREELHSSGAGTTFYCSAGWVQGGGWRLVGRMFGWVDGRVGSSHFLLCSPSVGGWAGSWWARAASGTGRAAGLQAGQAAVHRTNPPERTMTQKPAGGTAAQSSNNEVATHESSGEHNRLTN